LVSQNPCGTINFYIIKLMGHKNVSVDAEPNGWYSIFHYDRSGSSRILSGRIRINAIPKMFRSKHREILERGEYQTKTWKRNKKKKAMLIHEE
jgi:hypothetical protein